MKMTVLGSGSSGNCYLFTASSGRTLIVEAGIKMQEIKQGLGWKLNKVDGCIVSHHHKDHSFALKELLSCGVNVLANIDTLAATNARQSSFSKVIEPYHGYIVGEFRVYAFPVEHDVPCMGFVISHPEMGKTLFVTDTMLLEQSVQGLDHIMLECNYSDEILQYNIDNGIVPAGMRDRLMRSHMELQTTKGVIKNTDLSHVKDIVLVHLSSNNSDAHLFEMEITLATGLPTYCACKGMVLDLTK